MEKKKEQLSVGPFGVRIDAPAQKDFDKYYEEVEVKTVFKKTGQLDDDGNELGVPEDKIVIKKIDIQELINSQKDSVGVEAYIKNLMAQGVDMNDMSTIVDNDKVVDYSNMPDTLAEVMTAGDKAKAAFANLDPALKGEHTTIEGFLNGLTQEKIDAYITGRIEALTANTKKEGE